MKKLLGVVLALAMGATLTAGLVACGKKEGGGNGKSDAEIAQEAIETVKDLYDSALTETDSTYTLIGRTKIVGSSDYYAVNWSVDSDVEGYEEYVSVGKMDETSKQVTVTITPGPEAVAYTLTASVTVGEVTRTADFERLIPAQGTVYTVAEARALAAALESDAYYKEGDDVVTPVLVKGYVVDRGTYNSQYTEFQKFYIADTYSETFDVDTDKNNADVLYIYNAKIGTVIEGEADLVKGDLVTIKGVLQNYKGNTPEMTYYNKNGTNVQPTFVAVKRGERTDADLVAIAKNSVDVSTKYFAATGTLTLPAQHDNGAEYSWKVTTETDLVTITGNTLNIVKLPEAETKVTLTVTISFGEEKATKDVTITVAPAYNYTGAGTLEDPYTIADALALGKTLATDGYYTERGAAALVYVEGYVSNTGSWSDQYGNWSNVVIADENGANTITLYRLGIDAFNLKAKADLVKGSYIVVAGYLQNYKGNTPQITYFGQTNPTAAKYEKAQVDTPPEGAGAKLSFDDSSKRTTLTADEQVWEDNGIKFTNGKGTGTAIDTEKAYYNPVRLYKNSTVKVEFTGMTNIVFTCNVYLTNDYVTPLKESLEKAGYTVTVDGLNVIVVLDSAANSIEFTATNQIRLDSVEVNADVTVTPGPGPDLDLEGAGTEASPFTVADAKKIIATLDSGAYYQVNGANEAVYVKGYVTNTPETLKNGKGLYQVFLADEKGGSSTILAYSVYWNDLLQEGMNLSAGDLVVIYGYLQNYNGTTPEITYTPGGANPTVAAWEKAGGSTDPDPDPEDPEFGKLPATDFNVTDIPTLLELDTSADKSKYFVIGFVESFAASDFYCNFYIVDEEGNKLYIFGLFDEKGEQITITAAKALFEVGDAVVLYGQITTYNGTNQMKDAWLVQLGESARTDVAKLALAGITTIPANATEDFDLPTMEGLTWSVLSGTGIKIEGNTAKVTRTSEEQTVVLQASITVAGTSATREFTVKIQAEVEGLEEILVTHENLLLGKSGYTSSSNKVGAYTFSYTDMGQYGWLQMRKTQPSKFWNDDAFEYAISKVEVAWNAKNQTIARATALTFEFANNAAFTDAQEVSMDAPADGSTTSVNAPEGSFFYIRIRNSCSNALYIDSFKIICEDDGTTPPTTQEPDPSQPGGGEDVETQDYVLSFKDVAPTTFEADTGVWTANGITVTQTKSGSTNVNNTYTPTEVGHARWYSGHGMSIAFEGNTIKKIVFVCTSNDYATTLQKSVASLGTAEASGTTVTLTLTTPNASIDFTMNGQARVATVTVSA